MYITFSCQEVTSFLSGFVKSNFGFRFSDK